MPQKALSPKRPWDIKRPDNAAGQGRRYVTGFYQSKEWRKVRNQYIIEHPFCVECYKIGKTVEATVVDHVIQLNQKDPWDLQDGKYPDPLDTSNFQSLCQSHHNSKSAKERHGKNSSNSRAAQEQRRMENIRNRFLGHRSPLGN
jgi:5-methylcytosine-specific restriction endonuclease McrA